MRKFFTFLVFILLVLASIPALCGFWVKHTVEKYVNNINVSQQKMGVHIKIKEYQMGWLRSQIKTEITLKDPELVTLVKTLPGYDGMKEITFEDEEIIEHGPVIFNPSEPDPLYFGRAVLRSTFYSGAASSQNKPALMITSKLDYFGGFHASLTSPAESFASAQGLHVSWGPIKGNVKFDSQNEKLSTLINFGPVKITHDNKMNIMLSNPALQIDGEQIRQAADSPLLYGKFENVLKIEKIEGSIQEVPFEFDDVTQKVMKDIDSNNYSGSAEMTVRAYSIKDWKSGQVNWRVYWENYSTPALMNVLSMIAQHQKYDSDVPVNGKTLEAYARIFQATTRVGLDSFTMSTPNGDLKANLDFTFDGLKTPDDVLTVAKGVGNLTVDKTLVTHVINSLSDEPIQDKGVNKKLLDQRLQAAKMFVDKVNELVKEGKLDNTNAQALLAAANNDAPLKEMKSIISGFVSAKEIDIESSNNLLMLYNVISSPLKNVSSPSLREQAKESLGMMLEKGYLRDTGTSYTADIDISQSGFIANGKSIVLPD